MAPLAVIRRHPVAFAVGTLVLIALLVAGGVYYSHAAKRVSTDDAFIEARIIRISAKVAGQVEKVLVEDNQEVTEGQLLVQIDERPYRAVVDEARAQARAAEVEAENAEADAKTSRRPLPPRGRSGRRRKPPGADSSGRRSTCRTRVSWRRSRGASRESRSKRACTCRSAPRSWPS